jgi:hypothetical protein
MWSFFIRKEFSHSKDESLSFVTTWIAQEIFLLSEISLEQKDKYHMILIIYRKIYLNKIENRMVVTNDWGVIGWARRDGEMVMKRYLLIVS